MSKGSKRRQDAGVPMPIGPDKSGHAATLVADWVGDKLCTVQKRVQVQPAFPPSPRLRRDRSAERYQSPFLCKHATSLVADGVFK